MLGEGTEDRKGWWWGKDSAKSSFLRCGPKEVRQDCQEETKLHQDDKLSILGWSQQNWERYINVDACEVGPEGLPDRS